MTGRETIVPAITRAKRALVVDDQECNRIVLVHLLAKLGVAAASTGNGTEALALASQEDFDPIFLDYNLPGLSGPDVSRGIRALATGSARARILAITAFCDPEKQAECLAAGMTDFLGKPVSLERLRRTLTAPGAHPSPTPLAPPVDRLANLRLIARKKQVKFEEELALYFTELLLEMGRLKAAILSEDRPVAAHYAHRLCGHCGFINERELVQLLRQMHEIAAQGRWSEAHQLWAQLHDLAGALRLRLVSSVPVAPPA